MATTSNTPRLDSGLPGTWIVDPSHSSVEFRVRYLGMSLIKGFFTQFDGRLDLADDPARSSVQGQVDVLSLTTRGAERDAHLLSGAFLDVGRHRALTWCSEEIVAVGPDRWTLSGPATIRGITRAVVFDAALRGVAVDGRGNRRLAISARAVVDRREFGITWDQRINGVPLVGYAAELALEISALRCG